MFRAAGEISQSTTPGAKSPEETAKPRRGSEGTFRTGHPIQETYLE